MGLSIKETSTQVNNYSLCTCFLVYLFTFSRLHRLPRFDPGLEPAQDGSDFLITVLQKDKRRTGARVFLQSGAVGDDPLGLVQVYACWICFDLSQRNGQCTGNVTVLVRLRAAHIHDDCLPAMNRRNRVLYRYTRNIGFGLRHSAGYGGCGFDSHRDRRQWSQFRWRGRAACKSCNRKYGDYKKQICFFTQMIISRDRGYCTLGRKPPTICGRR